MLTWSLLIVGVLAGAAVLLQANRFSFRGATLLGFLLITLGMTSPLALYPGQMMLASGTGTDAFIGVWDLWWARVAATQGLNVLETSWLLYPHGTNLALHTSALTYCVASLPIQTILAPGLLRDPVGNPGMLFVVYNLILIASFTLTGYFTYRLAFSETGHRVASILAGVLFAFTNFRFANTVRLHCIATELLVLATWAWVLLLRRPSPRQLVLWFGAMILLVYGSLEYTAYTLPLFVILAVPTLAHVLQRDSSGTRLRPWAGLRAQFLACRKDIIVVAGGIVMTAVMVLPLLVQLARLSREGPMGFEPRMAQFFSADLFDFFLPNPRHPLWGGVFAAITGSFHRGNDGFGLTLGWIAIALFAATAPTVLRAHQNRRWFWGFVIFWVLALGPTLHIGGSLLTGFPMPQAVLKKIVPFLAVSRTPIRYVVPAGLCLALVVATGWAMRERSRPLAKPIPALILALILFESLAAPLPLVVVPVPGVYREVTAAAGSSVLVNIPAIPARYELLYQTVHRQRLADNVESVIPLRSRRGTDLFATSQWSVLTGSLGTKGWVASLGETQREGLAAELRLFLLENRIRWLVLWHTQPTLTPQKSGFSEKRLLEDAVYDNFLENLHRLGPLRHQESNGYALFEFQAEGLDPRR